MGRRYDDDVDVRVDVRATPQDGPTAFVWRQRLYLVHEVLGHWHERAAWWEGPAGAGVAAAGDREVWRVAAAIGRGASSGGTGTYDLGRDGGAPQWQLLAVVD